MSEAGGPDDPFSASDADAAERERRRRSREERRKTREEGARRSLSERVSGAMEAAGSAAEEGREALAGATPEGGRLSASLAERRLPAIGGLIAGIVIIVVAVGALGGGDDPPPPVATVEDLQFTQLTIPEGLTRTQIASLAQENKLKGSYLAASKRAPRGFSLKRYEAADAPSLEGFLFPATYELEKRARVAELVAKQLEAFESNLAQVNLKKAAKKNLTAYDVVIIASMIEREISVAKERTLAAAVIYNRLSSGEPLGIDATLRYELDNFTKPLLQSELQTDSAYNTRTRTGLPPTPIANPGLASLQAAAEPASSDARFYVIKPGTCNEHVFTADPAEFEAASAEYQAALQAEGGSPTDCPG